MGSTTSFARGLVLGAGLMYLLDGERGQTRREKLARRAGRILGKLRGSGSEDLELDVVSVGRYGSRVGDIEGLGAATIVSRPPEWRSTESPGSALRAVGALLALYGLTRGGPLGRLLRTVGTGMVVGSVGQPFSMAALPRLDRRRAVDIQKTLHIAAPVDQVYAFWSNYENFPLFMSHVREVEDLGNGRSRWSVSGPGGLPIEWNAVLTQQTPNSLIAWRSEPGSMLENAGVIRFVPVGGGTQVDLRLCYHPPAGGAGQAVAELLGSDPRAKLNDDLGRMKSLLESTHRSESHGQESRS